jgi:hypothetical protein
MRKGIEFLQASCAGDDSDLVSQKEREITALEEASLELEKALDRMEMAGHGVPAGRKRSQAKIMMGQLRWAQSQMTHEVI